jgi:signal transduction histidine kinase
MTNLVRKVLQLQNSRFIEKNVRVEFPVTADYIGQVDSAQIEQVILNLVLNAMDASAPGDVITIRLTPRGISVKDEGSGMTKEQLEKLFTPFFTTKPQGTGLGLSNCRKIVEAHGGTIHAQSELGLGTTFRVEFANNSYKRVA